MADELAAVVMAAGIGTRMKSATPKHLHPLLGRRMVDWVVGAAREAGVERLVVVASRQTSDALEKVEVAVQEEPRGTGDAVRCARAALEGFGGDVLVLNGDVPALRSETIRALVATHRAAGAAATVLSVGVLRWPMIPVVLCLAPVSIGLALLDRRGGRA